MNIWLIFLTLIPFLAGFLISRWISSNATKALEPHHKVLLVDFSTGSQKSTILWLILTFAPIIIFPRAGVIIFAVVMIVGNWMILKRLWGFEFPEFYKQKTLIATSVFSIGALVTVISFYVLLYMPVGR
jgi:hypothetical protein